MGRHAHLAAWATANALRSAIANQESLGLLEVEMRKLEDVVKEIVDEMGYLQRREMRMRDTNGEPSCALVAKATT